MDDKKLNAANDLVISLVDAARADYPLRKCMRWTGFKRSPMDLVLRGQVFWKENTVCWSNLNISEADLFDPLKIEAKARDTITKDPPDYIESEEHAAAYGGKMETSRADI